MDINYELYKVFFQQDDKIKEKNSMICEEKK